MWYTSSVWLQVSEAVRARHALGLDVLLHEVLVVRVAARAEPHVRQEELAAARVHKDGQQPRVGRLLRDARMHHGPLSDRPEAPVARAVRKVLELELHCGRLRKAARVPVVHVGERLARGEVHLPQRHARRRVERREQALRECRGFFEEHARVRLGRPQRARRRVVHQRRRGEQAAQHADGRLKHVQTAMHVPVELVPHIVARAPVAGLVADEDQHVERIDDRVPDGAGAALGAEQVAPVLRERVVLVKAPRVLLVRGPRLGKRLLDRGELGLVGLVRRHLGQVPQARELERHRREAHLALHGLLARCTRLRHEPLRPRGRHHPRAHKAPDRDQH